MRPLTPEPLPLLRHDGTGRLPRRRVTDRVNVARALTAAGEMPTRIAAFDWKRDAARSARGLADQLAGRRAMVLENRFPMTLFWGPELCHRLQRRLYPRARRQAPVGARPAGADGLVGDLAHHRAADRSACSPGRARPGTSTCCSRWTARGSARRPTSPSRTAPSATTPARSAASWSPARRRPGRSRASGSSRCCASSAPRGSAAGRESVEVACRTAARILAKNDADVPFALIYLFREGGTGARAGRHRGDATATRAPASPPRISTFAASRRHGLAARGGARAGQLRRRRRSARPASDRCRADAGGRRPSRRSCSAWPAPGRPSPTGFLIAGVSPLRVVRRTLPAHVPAHRRPDHRRHPAPRAPSTRSARRAEALAALDRAKTAFFSNVSHEFRTPLMLMLGPTEDLLSGVHGELPPPQRAQLELVAPQRRPAAQAGQRPARHRPPRGGAHPALVRAGRPAALTRDLAALVPAGRRAGRPGAADRLRVRSTSRSSSIATCGRRSSSTSSPTRSSSRSRGRSTSRCARADGNAVLRVADTGVGIAADADPAPVRPLLPGRRARGPGPHEGSGIGLALVQELVKLHKGTIGRREPPRSAEPPSRSPSRGARPTSPPSASAPRRSSRRRRLGATPFVEEALRLASRRGASRAVRSRRRRRRRRRRVAGKSSARILIVDDNADMRDYLRRLIERQWTVEVAADGAARPGGHPAPAARSRADRRDDAALRRVRAPASAARRQAHRRDPGGDGVGPRG